MLSPHADAPVILAETDANPACGRAVILFTHQQVRQRRDADVTILDADPSNDVRNFARVGYAIVGGRFTYRR